MCDSSRNYDIITSPSAILNVESQLVCSCGGPSARTTSPCSTLLTRAAGGAGAGRGGVAGRGAGTLSPSRRQVIGLNTAAPL